MVILKKQNKKGVIQNTSFVGAYIPINEASFFNLYCIATENSKDAMIKKWCHKWYERYVRHESKYITAIAEKAFDIWNNSGKSRRQNFSSFTSDLKKELEKKGVVEAQVNAIINHIQKMKDGKES